MKNAFAPAAMLFATMLPSKNNLIFAAITGAIALAAFGSFMYTDNFAFLIPAIPSLILSIWALTNAPR